MIIAFIIIRVNPPLHTPHVSSIADPPHTFIQSTVYASSLIRSLTEVKQHTGYVAVESKASEYAVLQYPAQFTDSQGQQVFPRSRIVLLGQSVEVMPNISSSRPMH